MRSGDIPGLMIVIAAVAATKDKRLRVNCMITRVCKKRKWLCRLTQFVVAEKAANHPYSRGQICASYKSVAHRSNHLAAKHRNWLSLEHVNNKPRSGGKRCYKFGYEQMLEFSSLAVHTDSIVMQTFLHS